jgi:hypothetical protein
LFRVGFSVIMWLRRKMSHPSLTLKQFLRPERPLAAQATSVRHVHRLGGAKTASAQQCEEIHHGLPGATWTWYPKI